ncbi:hypothetical protein WOC76_01680 [Methylocystis sp. IM3]|uniref:hypothetical protein n=1 Tax=unclassified Methylocystis TaxID=2625913 RepID=UPI0030F991ED
MRKSRTLLIIGLLAGVGFGARGNAAVLPCDPSNGRVTSRIACLAKINQLFNEQLESLKAQLARSSTETDKARSSELSELNQRIASFQTDLAQYAKTSDLQNFVRGSDFRDQLSSLKTELAKSATQTDLSAYAKVADVNQRMASLQSDLHQFAKASDLNKYATTSDLFVQLTALKSELIRRPRWEDFYRLESNLQSQPPLGGKGIDTYGSASKQPTTDASTVPDAD